MILSNSPSTLRPSALKAYKSLFYSEDLYSDANIKVDYDTNRNPLSIRRIVSVLVKNEKNLKQYKCEIGELLIFSTKKGHHLRLWLFNSIGIGIEYCLIPSRLTLRIQSELNDDPQRQIFNKRRVRRGEEYWNVLWRKKIRNGKTVSEEILDEELTNKVKELLQKKLSNV